jgi:hypothetical protein
MIESQIVAESKKASRVNEALRGWAEWGCACD